MVWFKKERQVHDHLRLLKAARGSVPPLCIYESEQLHHPEFGGRRQYLNECLGALNTPLRALGTPWSAGMTIGAEASAVAR